MPDLRLFTLGSPRLERDGRPLKVDRHKSLALLVYLAVTGERQRREALAALFWPDYDQVHARAALRRTLSALNSSLARSALDADRDTIGLADRDDPELWVDLKQFRDLVATCRLHGHPDTEACPDCLGPLAEAVALHRGDFLAGFTLRDSADFDDWQFFQTETLRRELAAAMERLARGHAAAGQFETAIGYARRWLALDPLHEPAHCYLMSLYAWAGQRQAALRQYAECARLLERELSVPPQAATTRLYQAIKEESLAGPVGPLDFSALSPVTKDVRSLSPRGRELPGRAVAGTLSLLERIVRGRLVGREREVAQVTALWNRAAGGQGGVLLISGEAGIGKTRLAREAATIAKDSSARVLMGRCDAQGAAPFAPIAQIIRADLDDARDSRGTVPDYILADLLTLAPQLRSSHPQVKPNPSLDPAFERQRLFDSFVSWCEILANEAPLLVCVEDVHWADDGTQSLLRYLGQRLQSQRLLLVMTFRDAEVDLAGARGLKEMLFEMDRERLGEVIGLGRMSRDEARDLLASMLETGGEISPEFLDSVYRETEGNPFFIEEVCKALIDEGKLYLSGGHWQRTGIETMVIPRSVRAAILTRVEKLPASTQAMLRVAAILGREFDLATLEAVGTWDEESLVAMLDHVVRAQFVVEAQRVGSVRFAFAHALIPFTLRESLSGLRLQRLHGRAASAIEARHPNDFEVLAYHYALAGVRDKAFAYARRAAERAEALHAHETAIQHLRTALDMLDDEAPIETRLSVHEQLADVSRLNGERAEAIAIYQDALDLWRSQPDADKWVAVRLCRKIDEAFLLLGSGSDRQRYEVLSRSSLETGLSLIEGEPPHPEAVRLLASLANDARGLRPQPDWDAAERYARAAVAMGEMLDAPLELSAALAALGIVLSVRGSLRESAQVALRGAGLSRDRRFRDRGEQCRLLCQAGNALAMVGDYDRALSYLFEAERLADQLRDVTQQVYALGLQAVCFFGLDRWDEMLQIDYKRQALDKRYGHNRVGIMCFYCGMSANVTALRGDFARAAELVDIAYVNMRDALGWPLESSRWPRAGNY